MNSSKQDPGEPQNQDSPAGSGAGAETELYTLGHVRLIEQGSERTSKLGPKHLALLVYLAHERRPMHPTEVTELLGRGQAEDKEIAALRRAVSWLTENVPGVVIRMSADSIDSITGVWVDSVEVDGAIDRGDPGLVEQLYVGEFLEGFESGSPAFDEWAKRERGRVKRAWSHAMLAASRRAEQDNDWDVAAQWWQLLVSRAPMRPDAVASLLRAYMKAGQEDRATTAYFSYAALLAESGISQPADAVKEVLAEHLTLQESTGVRVELPQKPPLEEPEETDELVESESIADVEEATPEATEPVAEAKQEQTFESLSAALDAEFEDEIHIGPRDPDLEPATEGQGIVAGQAEPDEDTADPESLWLDEEPAPLDEEAGEVEWPDVVDLASSEEIEFELTGEFSGETLPDEEEAPVSEPIAGLDDDGEELIDVAHDLVTEEKLDEVIDEPEPAPSAAVRETPYDLGAAYLDAQVESAAEEENVESESPGPPAGEAPVAGLFGAPRAFGRKLGTLASSAVSGRSSLARLRHYWYVPVALGVAALAFVLGPKLLVTFGGLAEDLPEVNKPALPRVNLPKVKVKAPGFVETSVSRIGELLSGPILDERGQWVVVADFQLETPPSTVGAETPSESDEAGPSEDGSGEGDPIESSAAADTMAPPERRDSATTAGEDTGRAAALVSAGSISLGETAPGRSDAGIPGPGPASLESSVTSLEAAPPRVSRPARQDTNPPVREGATPPPVQQDTTRQEKQDTTPAIPQDTAPALTEALDSAGVADTAQSIGADSLSEGATDSTLTAPTSVAAPDSVQQSPAEPQERLSLAAMTTVVEADLEQAKFFSVVPRERALSALQSIEGRTTEVLPVEAALRVAEHEGWAAVVSGRVWLGAEVDSVKLLVLNATGDTLYGVAAELSSQETALETLAELAHAIRRRFGEPEEEIDSTPPLRDLLSARHAALNAYSEARADVYAGRLPQAVSAGREAVQRDTAFVLAYLVLADAYAQGGERASGRSALENAWNLSGLATERDSMRIHADRLAWDGRFSEAVVTYDDLFQRYRDDVAALKSQALLQRMIGARGGGEGNLRVAYTIDPYNWPRLSRIARYLGYTGTLPDVDSLVTSLRQPPREQEPTQEPSSDEERTEG